MPASQPIAFDPRPLTDPVDPKAVSAFVRAAQSARRGPSAGLIVGIVGGAIALPVLLVLVPLLFTMVGPFALLGAVVLGALIAGIIAIIVSAQRRGRIARYRLSTFAAANNMTYIDRITAPPLPGMIFQIGHSRRADRIVRGVSPRFVEFGNYQYTTGSGEDSNTYNWGYIAVKLDVPLPNIVLDALGNNSFRTNLPASFRKDQRLSLEGDFDRYFSLYCPAGYEQDALYLFTPDIMARFIDHAAELDVEIVDDWMFLYTKRKVSTLDPQTWAWLFGVVGALMTKFDQWARWRDDRLRASHGPAAVPAAAAPTGGALPFAAPAGMLTPPAGVAAPGRRLKRRRTWLIIVVALVALWIIPMFITGVMNLLP